MTEPPNKPGRPRKWKSDAERMRARRAAQRADRERYAEQKRVEVLADEPDTDPAEAADAVARLPNPKGVRDVEKLLDLLMIACRVEGGIHEWLHESCIEEYEQLLTKYVEEQRFASEVMAEAKSLDHRARRMMARLQEVDPDGPFKTPRFVTDMFPELREREQ